MINKKYGIFQITKDYGYNIEAFEISPMTDQSFFTEDEAMNFAERQLDIKFGTGFMILPVYNKMY